MRSLAGLGEAVRFEGHQHHRREVVVDLGNVDLPGLQLRCPIQLRGRGLSLLQSSEALALIAGHHLRAAARALGRRGDVCRGPLELLRLLRGDDDRRTRAVRVEAAVEQAQRLCDPAGALVVLQRDRAFVHHGVRIGGRVFATQDGDAAELLGCVAILMQVTLTEDGDPLRRRHQTVWYLILAPSSHTATDGGLSKPTLRALVQRAEGDDHVCHA